MKHQASSYRVGPHRFRIVNHSNMNVPQTLPSLSPFAVPAHSGEAVIFELHLADAESGKALEEQDTDICFDWEDARCIIRPQGNGAHIVAISPRDAEESYRMECTDGFRRCTAYLPSGETATSDRPAQKDAETARSAVESFVLNNFLMMLYAFNAARHHTLLMHASVIASGHKGYLFLGKSGTGKSTHTSLWLKHIPGCHLLNDDNPVVHVDEAAKQVTVFGSPWSGKTPCYRNESMPVGAFVRLEQAPHNEIKKEGTVRAFAALLPSCSCLKQDKEIYGGIVSTVTDLASLTSTYHLKCLPDAEAAKLCRQTVEGKGVETGDRVIKSM